MLCGVTSTHEFLANAEAPDFLFGIGFISRKCPLSGPFGCFTVPRHGTRLTCAIDLVYESCVGEDIVASTSRESIAQLILPSTVAVRMERHGMAPA